MDNGNLEISMEAEDGSTSDVIEIDIQNLCRLCGLAHENLVPIYEAEDQYELLFRIKTYLHITINEIDFLPHKVCTDCTSVLIAFHKLYMDCLAANERFENILNESIEEALTEDDPQDKSADQLFQNNDQAVYDVPLLHDSIKEIAETIIPDNIKDAVEPVTCTKKQKDNSSQLGRDDSIASSDDTVVYLNNQSKSNKFGCGQCSSAFATNNKLTVHIIEAHQNNRCPNKAIKYKNGYFCEICNLTFQHKSELKEHKLKHNSFQCNICKKVFKKELYLILHKNKHSNNIQNTFACPICNHQFNRKYNMEKHISGHLEDNACNICCLSFVTPTALNKHKTGHSKEELQSSNDFDATINCKLCEKDVCFKSKLTLYMHNQNIHETNIIEFTCKVCKKKFKTESILQTHMKNHSKDEISCDICLKKFSSEKTLNDHIRIHTGDRPFMCKLCNKSFRYQSNLHQHTLSHANERRFKCLYCSLLFLRSNTLRDHLRIHFNEKPYKCKHCHKAFTQAGVLKKHNRAMHQKCDVCDLVVGNKTKLLVHSFKGCSDKGSKHNLNNKTNK